MGSTGSADPDNASLGPPDAVRAVRSANPLDRFTSQGLLRPNIALRYGLYDARVHDHPTVARYSRLWTELIPTSSSFRTEFDDRGPSSLSSCWISSRCGAFSSRVPGSRGAGLRREARVRGEDTVVATNDLALPRAFLATAWASSSGVNDALAEVASTDRAQLRRRPIIEGAPTTRGASADPLPQQVTRYDDHEVEIAVDAPRAGYLVLTDTFFPGWKAEVDRHASASCRRTRPFELWRCRRGGIRLPSATAQRASSLVLGTPSHHCLDSLSRLSLPYAVGYRLSHRSRRLNCSRGRETCRR